jgi:glutathione synthase/RimK-type ligase-like ATP-grasp enzyme
VRFAVVGHRRSDTNLALARAGSGVFLAPREALLRLAAGDVALARLEVLETLDGVDPGLDELGRLEATGVTVLNPPRVLLAAHDKLLTARALRLAGLPHPWTGVLAPGRDPPVGLPFPVALRPRFGSRGAEAIACRDVHELAQAVECVSQQRWFTLDGALVQELVPPCPALRLLVAAGRVVGASPELEPPASARRLAEEAAAALAADLVAVDLLPDGNRSLILDVDGALDLQPWHARGPQLAMDAVLALLERAGAARAA